MIRSPALLLDVLERAFLTLELDLWGKWSFLGVSRLENNEIICP